MQLKVWTDDMELSDDPFKPIFEVLDKLFQHEEEVELPERCQEFFEKFNRERGGELQAYLVRHQTMWRKLKDSRWTSGPCLLVGIYFRGQVCRGRPMSRSRQCAMVT